MFTKGSEYKRCEAAEDVDGQIGARQRGFAAGRLGLQQLRKRVICSLGTHPTTSARYPASCGCTTAKASKTMPAPRFNEPFPAFQGPIGRRLRCGARRQAGAWHALPEQIRHAPRASGLAASEGVPAPANLPTPRRVLPSVQDLGRRVTRFRKLRRTAGFRFCALQRRGSAGLYCIGQPQSPVRGLVHL